MTYLLLLLAGIVALVVSLTGSLTLSVVAGLAMLGLALVAVNLLNARARGGQDADSPASPSRRKFLGWAAVAGLFFVAGGTTLGRVIRRVTKPDPGPIIQGMATDLGAEYMELVRRGYHAPTSGDLQLLLAPGNSSNYPQESATLIHNDPRTSHASVWMYLERVPMLVYAPGLVAEGTVSRERVTLADIAPTIASLMRFEDFPQRDGRPLPGVAAPGKAPKVIVTFVIDGGGWNVLDQWKDATPNLRRLMDKSTLYTNALHGSFPAVTASAHATIGTGAFPAKHGISGHNLRFGTHVRKAYGLLGQAQPGDIQIPTLADLWTEHTGGKAFIGEFGYQIWHLGMIGKGGTSPLGDKPVAVYWDEPNYRWAPQNDELFRLPKIVPPDTRWKQEFEAWKMANPDDFPPEYPAFSPKQTPACSPPIIRYEGDVVAAAFDSEDIGNHEATDLVFINYKSPDYTGHIYNMLKPQEEVVLRAVDAELQRVVDMLGSKFAPGEYALIVTADHGQCPLPDDVDGVRLDPTQLKDDIQREFGGRSLYPIVHEVAPSEVFLDGRGLLDSGSSAADIAAWLKDYTYGENYHLYKGVPRDAIEWDRVNYRIFSGIMPGPYVVDLQQQPAVTEFGRGDFADADPGGIPKLT